MTISALVFFICLWSCPLTSSVLGFVSKQQKPKQTQLQRCEQVGEPTRRGVSQHQPLSAHGLREAHSCPWVWIGCQFITKENRFSQYVCLPGLAQRVFHCIRAFGGFSWLFALAARKIRIYLKSIDNSLPSSQPYWWHFLNQILGIIDLFLSLITHLPVSFNKN